MSIWIHSLIAMADSELDTCRAGINAMMACAFDPLPVVEVGFIYRCVLNVMDGYDCHTYCPVPFYFV